MDQRQKDEIAFPDDIKNNLKEIVHEHKNAAIGAGISAAVGAAFGGPIGAAIGGAVGGYVGSLFDSEQEEGGGEKPK